MNQPKYFSGDQFISFLNIITTVILVVLSFCLALMIFFGKEGVYETFFKNDVKQTVINTSSKREQPKSTPVELSKKY